MPAYPYKCKCGHETEIHKPMSAASMIEVCPVCFSEMTKDFSKLGFAYHDVPFDSVTKDLTGKPITYHTRGQLKRIAAQHGCDVEFGVSNRRHER